MSFSNYCELKILDAVLNNTAFAVTTPYMSLHTADPGETGASEVVGGSYGRQSSAWDAASGTTCALTSAVSFTSMPAATVTHFGVWDASSSGNFLLGGSLTASKTTNSGDTLQVDSATATATNFSTYLAPKVLDAILNNTSLAVATPYMSLHQSDPGATGASEVSGGSYARQNNDWNVAAAGQCTNNGAVQFTSMPDTTGDDISYFGVFDALTVGNFLFGDALDAARTTNSGDTFEFADTVAVVTCD